MVVDGVELLRMIRDSEIEEDTDIIDTLGNKYTYMRDEYDTLTLYECDFVTGKKEIPDYSLFVDKENEFEIIEKETEIDIQAIEEISIRPFRGYTNICEYIEEKGNEIIKAIKQLDKKIGDTKC